MIIKTYKFPFKTLLLSILIALLFIVVVVPGKALATSSVAKVAQNSTGSYQSLGRAQGRGAVQVSMVGPGATVSGQSYYQVYTYVSGVLDLVVINPDTGAYQTYSSPVSSEQGAWGMTVGPDKNMYIGTLPNAHLLKFNTTSSKLVDLGSVPADPTSGVHQSYVWQLTTSPYNNKIYGCTYPSADLVSYNPLDAGPKIVNLGTMDTTGQEQYVRYCVADPNPANPYIYLGLGSVTSQIAVYNIETNKIVARITSPTSGFGSVYQGSDNNIYGSLMNGNNKQYYQLSNGINISSNYSVSASLMNTFTDGRTIAVGATSITITYPDKLMKVYPYLYAGQPQMIFRMGLGPDQKIYGGTALPYDLFSYDPASPAAGVTTLGQAGGGEPYSLLTVNNQLYIASYAAPSALSTYNSVQSFGIKTNPSSISSSIPTDLRSQAMVAAPNNHVYIGAIASYGQLTGPLISWNTQNNSDIVQYYPVPNQGISSLAVAGKSCKDVVSGSCLIGGTTVIGGGGTVSKASSAVLFSWDTTKNVVAHQYTIPNVGAVSTITDLVTNPANGYVYGIACASSGTYAFVFNPATGKFINGGTLLPFSGAIYNSAVLYNGKIWGLTSQGVFSIDPTNMSKVTLSKSSATVTAGFVLRGSTMYFASNSQLWSYQLS